MRLFNFEPTEHHFAGFLYLTDLVVRQRQSNIQARMSMNIGTIIEQMYETLLTCIYILLEHHSF